MSSSRGSARPYHHGLLRQELLTAARTLLAGRPAAELSLREVARQAGVSHAAPYHHFSDRHALLLALGEVCMTEFVVAQEQAAAAPPTPLARLVALGEAYVGYAAQHPHAFTLIFDPQVCPPGSVSPLAPLIERNQTLLARLLAEAQASGDLQTAQPEVVAQGLWATVHGLAHLVMSGHLPPHATAQILWGLLSVEFRAATPR
ncbi:TetR/AcrR family transcriptional regulator [Deinococcus multiflagellatus]|uniref:TetR/AcrR family transcriptional regulator n=1 Tax=Deinococcus multiflagellatus TaxID=1656887 RepID=A0ABW1ZIP6_9DEIO|nr:TetR/AcrR family transcriptional regulator [Deinococcus multiflagellatus]MBZ9714309.1 TetR/AcrR family transcriptional regulator [Deinococcus multiflagellatus]